MAEKEGLWVRKAEQWCELKHLNRIALPEAGLTTNLSRHVSHATHSKCVSIHQQYPPVEQAIFHFAFHLSWVPSQMVPSSCNGALSVHCQRWCTLYSKLTNTYTQRLRQRITQGLKHVITDCVKQKSEGKRVSTRSKSVYTHTINKGLYIQVTNEDSRACTYVCKYQLLPHYKGLSVCTRSVSYWKKSPYPYFGACLGCFATPSTELCTTFGFLEIDTYKVAMHQRRQRQFVHGRNISNVRCVRMYIILVLF